MTLRRLALLLTVSVFCPLVSNPVFASQVPLTIDGVINCAHPDNAVTTTCRGESLPDPVPVAPVATEAAAAGTSILHSGDRSFDCSTEPDASDPHCLPLTIDGVINCAHPDNAVTTTCRGESLPDPVPVAPVATEAAAAGTSILHSGDRSFDCSTEPDASDPHCLPLTIDGVINCAHPDNAVTTTCWNAFQESKAKGETPTIDCGDKQFSAYPVCTGIKPQAVVDFENASRMETSTETIEQPKADTLTATLTAVAEDATTSISTSEGSNQQENTQPETAFGEISVQSIRAKTTTLSITLLGTVQSAKIVATKKGSRSITREIVLDSDGPSKVQFSRSLKGYQVKLLIDGLEVDRKRV
jgi:hypothetical protein